MDKLSKYENNDGNWIKTDETLNIMNGLFVQDDNSYIWKQIGTLPEKIAEPFKELSDFIGKKWKQFMSWFKTYDLESAVLQTVYNKPGAKWREITEEQLIEWEEVHTILKFKRNIMKFTL